MSRILCFECVQDMFLTRDYIYFITIKPPQEDDKYSMIYKLTEYLAARNITYWLVKCESSKGYVHFHGLISFPVSQTPHKGLHASLQRKVNRTMGYVQFTPIQGTVGSVYAYIRHRRNRGINGEYKQVDYAINSSDDHLCRVT